MFENQMPIRPKLRPKQYFLEKLIFVFCEWSNKASNILGLFHYRKNGLTLCLNPSFSLKYPQFSAIKAYFEASIFKDGLKSGLEIQKNFWLVVIASGGVCFCGDAQIFYLKKLHSAQSPPGQCSLVFVLLWWTKPDNTIPQIVTVYLRGASV